VHNSEEHITWDCGKCAFIILPIFWVWLRSRAASTCSAGTSRSADKILFSNFILPSNLATNTRDMGHTGLKKNKDDRIILVGYAPLLYDQPD
jgi:hypothetical protein